MKMLEVMQEGLQKAREERERGGDHISEYVDTIGRMTEALVNEDIVVPVTGGGRVAVCVALGIAFVLIRDEGLNDEDKSIAQDLVNMMIDGFKLRIR